MAATTSRSTRSWTSTADALDVGLLKFSNGAVIGTGASSTRRTSGSRSAHVLPIVAPADLAQVVVEERDGGPSALGDVANVVEDHQPLVGDAVINGGPGLMLVVEKLPWANTLDVTKGVEEALEDLRRA